MMDLNRWRDHLGVLDAGTEVFPVPLSRRHADPGRLERPGTATPSFAGDCGRAVWPKSAISDASARQRRRAPKLDADAVWSTHAPPNAARYVHIRKKRSCATCSSRRRTSIGTSSSVGRIAWRFSPAHWRGERFVFAVCPRDSSVRSPLNFLRLRASLRAEAGGVAFNRRSPLRRRQPCTRASPAASCAIGGRRATYRTH